MNSLVIGFNLVKQTRYLVFMITEVTKDFFPFFCVLLLTIFQYAVLNIYLQEKMGEKNETLPDGDDQQYLIGKDPTII